jgi:BlaI family transcriptional regulator, penicillinase repressor
LEKKRARHQFTPAELAIMKVLWERGGGTVQNVREKLPGHPGPAYTTVQTLLNILHRKGKVKRTLKGKSYEYAPKVSREGTASHAIRDLLDRLFGGSAEDLVMTLVKDRHLTAEKLEYLRQLVEQAQTGRRDAER